MANDKKYRKEVAKIKKKILPIIIAIIVCILWGIFVPPDDTSVPDDNTLQNETNVQGENNLTPEVSSQGELVLHMIECGQADSFLLIQNGLTVLVDCGETDTADDVVAYIKNLGITRIDYVIGTHPHDDHMGGMQEVITSFEVGKIIIPKMKANVSTANWFINLMEELASGKYKVEEAILGTVYGFGDATMTIIGPIEQPKSNTNNYSIVMKVTYGNRNIIMTGDAETAVEKDILETGVDLSADILKVGHHGSDTSNSEEWLDAINPKYALISCKTGNQHEHPIKSVMDRLKERGIEVYRTDECGSVVVTISAESITFSTAPGDYLSGEELERREGK